MTVPALILFDRGMASASFGNWRARLVGILTFSLARTERLRCYRFRCRCKLSKAKPPHAVLANSSRYRLLAEFWRRSHYYCTQSRKSLEPHATIGGEAKRVTEAPLFSSPDAAGSVACDA